MFLHGNDYPIASMHMSAGLRVALCIRRETPLPLYNL